MQAIVIALTQSLSLGLGLLKTKQARKYLEEVLSIQQELTNEFLKESQYQSDMRIIELQLRLLDINQAFQSFGTSNGGKSSGV